MNQKLVSVVVPVYNVEEYLPDCVDSILAQTHTNLQVILVDDGSKDDSGKICDSYAKKDARVCVLHQENQGAAAARKNGVQIAEGEYICFVDADDAVSSEMVQFLVREIGQCDVVTSGCIYKRLNGEETIRVDALPEGIYHTPEELDYFFENVMMIKGSFKDGLLPFLVGKLYRTQIMKDVIEVPDSRLFYDEDRALMLHYMLKCKSIRVTHAPYYEYRLRSGSAVNSVHPDMLHNLYLFYKSLETAFGNHPKKESLMRQLQMFLVSRLRIIPKWMGLHPEARMIQYLYQPNVDLRGKRIVLYGAGAVGKDFYVQMKSDVQSNIVLWVDKKWMEYTDSGYQIGTPEEIEKAEYDYILIAVKKQEVAEEIKSELVNELIPKEKILWIEPITLQM